jgi:hypothetical protein
MRGGIEGIVGGKGIMNGRHWTTDELIGHVYGVGPEDRHLETCEECSARAADFAARRQALATPPQIDPLFLAAQRRSLYARIRPKGYERRPVLAPLLAGAMALALGFVLLRPSPQQLPLTVDIAANGDMSLYSEIYQTIGDDAPGGVRISGLFEERGQEE